MNLKWHSKQTILTATVITIVLFLSVVVLDALLKNILTRFNFGVLDALYSHTVRQGNGVPLSPQIVYLLINDETYDDFFDSNAVDRESLAAMNNALAEYSPASVIYDIMFSRRSNPDADSAFSASLKHLGVAYLPTIFKYTDTAQRFSWGRETVPPRLRDSYFKTPQERGKGRPFYATQARTQWMPFAMAAVGSGNISSISSDPDGVYRHLPLFLKADAQYVPALALSAFLDYVRVPFDAVIVAWGKSVTIPAHPGSFVPQDIVIPIDERGRVFVPYPQLWANDFAKMTLQTFLQHSQRDKSDGELAEFFEGKFVFIGDVSTGISDLGNTPLEDDVPLLVVHTALLNGLLNNTFYSKWNFWQVVGFIGALALFLNLSAMPKSLRFLYSTGALLFVFILVFTWQQLQAFTLFPIVTVAGSFLFMFFGLLTGLHLILARDQAFIRSAFSKFVHERVVDELLDHPESLRLGGEERTLTVLFSDIEGFTSLSERMAPTAVVSWLNNYLTEMTEIILDEKGIIDKYIGDGVMAEFGAPLPLADHAERAVRAGLRMQRRLSELNAQWEKQNLPQVRCRIGINTGSMVVGNLGSKRVFSYTVTGDAVNLAARLESANKQYDTTFMISEFTHALLPAGLFRTRLLDAIKVKGRENAPPVKVYEVYGAFNESFSEADLGYYTAYDRALHAYLRHDFTDARELFLLALKCRPDDVITQRMLERLETLHVTEMPAEWDGSVVLEVK